MPCNTMTKQTVDVGLTNALVPVLLQALTNAGYNIDVSESEFIRATDNYGGKVVWRKGKGVEMVDNRYNVEKKKAALIQEYSKAAVSWAAQRAGFKQAGAWQGNKVTLQR